MMPLTVIEHCIRCVFIPLSAVSSAQLSVLIHMHTSNSLDFSTCRQPGVNTLCNSTYRHTVLKKYFTTLWLCSSLSRKIPRKLVIE